MYKKLFFILILLVLTATGCSGYSTYLQSATLCPPDAALGAKENNEFCDALSFDGITIKIDFGNDTKTSETVFVNDMIPIPIRLTDEVHKESSFVVLIDIYPKESGFFFYPKKVLLVADQQKHTLMEVSLWGEEAPPPEKQEELMEKGVLLIASEKGRGYNFQLKFAGPAPSPRKDISLDLSEALANDQVPKIPVIKFKGHRSSHWQT